MFHISQIKARWISFFAKYKFELKYRPGKPNLLVDALSRRPSDEFVNVKTMSLFISDYILNEYDRDDRCVALLCSLRKEEFTYLDIDLSARLFARIYRHYTLSKIVELHLGP